MIINKVEFLNAGDACYKGIVNENVIFTEKHQLLNKKTWDKFIEVFAENADDCDLGWRGEYFGKMIRGACLVYMYNGNPELYSVIEYAVRGLLSVQREDGRFSTYSEENQFNGWDMWSRKYVLTGMMHFLKICKDEKLASDVLCAICRHADYITEHIGSGAGKKGIFETSTHWLGVNSASILEPFAELYKLTGKESYLDFAKYIISLGGCSGDNLINLALEDRLAPFEYPETKAYETMSFFEGVLAYYEITGEKIYLDAVLKFTERIVSTDITVIGCSGCTHEIFDNSIIKQTEYSEYAMQETCVTVTWMRLLARLYLLTGDKKYADMIETSAFNALYGSLNTNNEKVFSSEMNAFADALPFDSYSPLIDNRRGIAIGGFKKFRTGGYYGCCACIGSAGIGIFPLVSVLKSEDGVIINEMLSGSVDAALPNGERVNLSTITNYPSDACGTVSLSLQNSKEFNIYIRIPAWCDEYEIISDGAEKALSNGYAVLSKLWKNGDKIKIDFKAKLKMHRLNGKTAFTYGPLVLARDEMKENKKTTSEFTPLYPLTYEIVEPEKGEMIRILLQCDGENVLLTDYASAGKLWTNRNSNISVWLNTK